MLLAYVLGKDVTNVTKCFFTVLLVAKQTSIWATLVSFPGNTLRFIMRMVIFTWCATVKTGSSLTVPFKAKAVRHCSQPKRKFDHCFGLLLYVAFINIVVDIIVVLLQTPLFPFYTLLSLPQYLQQLASVSAVTFDIMFIILQISRYVYHYSALRKQRPFKLIYYTSLQYNSQTKS